MSDPFEILPVNTKVEHFLNLRLLLRAELKYMSFLATVTLHSAMTGCELPFW